MCICISLFSDTEEKSHSPAVTEPCCQLPTAVRTGCYSGNFQRKEHFSPVGSQIGESATMHISMMMLTSAAQ